MCCIVQMSEYTILFLEVIWFFGNRFHVIGVPINSVRATQVLDLRDALFPIANLFIQQPWLHIVRVHIGLPGDDIMVHARPIVEGFAH